jgi:hypothetical protein
MKILRLLGRFFLDDAGEPSCQRLVSFLIIATVMAVWAWVSIRTGKLAELDPVMGGLAASALGFLALKTKYEAISPGDPK